MCYQERGQEARLSEACKVYGLMDPEQRLRRDCAPPTTHPPMGVPAQLR